MIGCSLASIAGTCVALAEKTRFYWPGKYSEKALRSHLATDPKHRFDENELGKLTFQDCIDLHDHHHENYITTRRVPFPDGMQIGETEGRGMTTVDDLDAWIERNQKT